jgi:hypothetical protein
MSIIVLILLAKAAAEQQEVERAGERIRLAQTVQAMERRAQHREVERVQPVSRLTPEEERANQKAQADRLVLPAQIVAK